MSKPRHIYGFLRVSRLFRHSQRQQQWEEPETEVPVATCSSSLRLVGDIHSDEEMTLDFASDETFRTSQYELDFIRMRV